MSFYRVKWVIEIEADNPTHAARLAREIQLDPESTALVFDVEQKAVVDLSIHPWIQNGYCAICDHYGDDCTGDRESENLCDCGAPLGKDGKCHYHGCPKFATGQLLRLPLQKRNS